MSYYGKGFGRFGQFKSKKQTEFKGLTKVKKTSTPVPKKKPVEKQFKKLTDEEIIERGAEAKIESMIRRGYTPRGKDIQREVNNYLNNHPLRESNINEKGRKRFLEFRQAKINALKKEKKDG